MSDRGRAPSTICTLSARRRPWIALYARQDLVGAGYGLIDGTTFQPRPDYWALVLWKRFMGNRVLNTTLMQQLVADGSDDDEAAPAGLRAYAHCVPGRQDAQQASLLLINAAPTLRNVPLGSTTLPIEKATRVYLAEAGGDGGAQEDPRAGPRRRAPRADGDGGAAEPRSVWAAAHEWECRGAGGVDVCVCAPLCAWRLVREVRAPPRSKSASLCLRFVCASLHSSLARFDALCSLLFPSCAVCQSFRRITSRNASCNTSPMPCTILAASLAASPSPPTQRTLLRHWAKFNNGQLSQLPCQTRQPGERTSLHASPHGGASGPIALFAFSNGSSALQSTRLQSKAAPSPALEPPPSRLNASSAALSSSPSSALMRRAVGSSSGGREQPEEPPGSPAPRQKRSESCALGSSWDAKATELIDVSGIVLQSKPWSRSSSPLPFAP